MESGGLWVHSAVGVHEMGWGRAGSASEPEGQRCHQGSIDSQLGVPGLEVRLWTGAPKNDGKE